MRSEGRDEVRSEGRNEVHKLSVHTEPFTFSFVVRGSHCRFVAGRQGIRSCVGKVGWALCRDWGREPWTREIRQMGLSTWMWQDPARQRKGLGILIWGVRERRDPGFTQLSALGSRLNVGCI